MNKIKITGNFVSDSIYHSIDYAGEVSMRRKSNLIGKTWFMLKLYSGSLISLSEGEHIVFLNVVNNYSDSAIQFYNKSGDLIMTYPWNGKFSGLNEGIKVDEYNNPTNENGRSLTNVYIELKDGEIRLYNEYSNESINASTSSNYYETVKVFTIEGKQKFNAETTVNKERVRLVKGNTVREIDSKWFDSKNNKNHYEIV